MEIWTILGIAPTKEPAEIKKAYHIGLQHANPEDKPEAFMALRQAYEQALEYARNQSSPDQEIQESESIDEDLLPLDHPAYPWTKKLIHLYRNFPSRIRQEAWEGLIQDPLCTRIDLIGDVEDALLRFLMHWWFVPDCAIRTLNEAFHFDVNRERLVKQYPEDFVDAILMTPLNRTGGGFDYNLFDGQPDMDYDSYINLYYTLTDLVSRGEYEQAWQCVSHMEATGIFHPYLNVEKAKLHLAEGQIDLAESDISFIWPKYESSPTVCCMAGEVLLARSDFNGAFSRFQQAGRLYPASRWSKIGMAEACLGLMKLEEAEDLINQVLFEDRYNPRGKELEDQIEAAHRQVLEEKKQSHTASAQELLKLGMIYVDQDDDEKAVEILSGFRCESRLDESERLHYLATAQLNLDDFADALDHFAQAESLLRLLLDMASGEDEKAHLMANLCRTLVMKSLVLENLQRAEEGLEVVTNGAIDFADQSILLCRKAELHYELHQYQEAIDAATASIALDDGLHLPFRIRANAYYELGYYNEAYEDCNRSIELYSGDIEAFFCKINVLIEAGETEEALEEIQSLEEQISGTKLTFLKGKAYEAAGDSEKALEHYLSVMKTMEDKERDIFYPSELDSLVGIYYRVYQVYRNLYERDGELENWRKALWFLRKGCERYPKDLSLVSALAGEYYSQSKHIEAQVLYERMVELEPQGRHYAQLAGNELQLDRFDAAEAHLRQAISISPELTYSQILLGALETHRENYPEALAHYFIAQEMAERNEEVWYRIYREMAIVYSRMMDYEKAIACLQTNYRLYHQEEDYTTMLEILRLQGKVTEAIRLGDSYLKDNQLADSQQVLEELQLAARQIDDFALFEHYQAMDLRPFNRAQLRGRFLAYQGKDKLKQALESFQESARFGSQRIFNNVQLAKLYLQLGEKEKASEYAYRVLNAIPDDFMTCGYNRAYYLTVSAEALAVLGNFEEAKKQAEAARLSRKCDFCKYSDCIDAYCALVYIACLEGNTGDCKKYCSIGKKISPYDYELLHISEQFTKRGELFR